MRAIVETKNVITSVMKLKNENEDEDNVYNQFGDQFDNQFDNIFIDQ